MVNVTLMQLWDPRNTKTNVVVEKAQQWRENICAGRNSRE